MANILIVDDDARNVYALSHVLEEKGLKILKAFDGKEALNVLKNNPVDLILMDIMMPDMSGWKTFDKINKTQSQISVAPYLRK